MVRHAVFFKFKADVNEADRADVVARLKALPERVPGILKPEVGEDFIKSPRSYDVALVFGFEDRAALDRYQKHPNHVSVGERVRPCCESVVAVDYEI